MGPQNYGQVSTYVLVRECVLLRAMPFLDLAKMTPQARARNRGSTGPAGPQGPKGEKGDSGHGSVSVYTKSNNFTTSGSAGCNPGDAATGGGYTVSPGTYVYASAPNGNGWSVSAAKLPGLPGSNGNASGTVYVVCVDK
jgi:hypothetical protein